MKEFPEKSGYIEIPHPADISIAVTAESLSALFLESFKALGDIAGVQIFKGSSQSGEFSVDGISNEGLLVAFLNEINFILENGFWPVDIHIEVALSYIHCAYQAEKCISKGYAIKAVTFSEMRIVQFNDHWHTKIVFDI